MNILILNWRDPKNPKAGGAEIVTHQHAKAWVKAGHAVTLFTSYFQNAKEREVIDGIHIIRKGNPVFVVQLKAFLWCVFNKHDKFDLIIDQFHGIPFFTPLYVKEKKLAFIHEVTKNVWRLNPWPKPFNLIPYLFGAAGEQWIFKLLYRNMPFLTVSQSTKDDLVSWGISAGHITIIHNGVSFPVLQPFPNKEKKKTIIFLGALNIDKGIKDAIYTFSYLNKNDSQWQFWMVGNGEKRDIKMLKDLSRGLGIEDKIKFWGYVDEKKKFELLARAHIIINPSEREGWGLVVIEAASQKTPAVVYDVPGLRDSVKDQITGIIVKKRIPEAMGKAIISLMEDKKRYKILQENSYNWAKSLTWKKATSSSLELISRI